MSAGMPLSSHLSFHGSMSKVWEISATYKNMEFLWIGDPRTAGLLFLFVLGRKTWRSGMSALMNLPYDHKRDFKYHCDMFPYFIFSVPLDPLSSSARGLHIAFHTTFAVFLWMLVFAISKHTSCIYIPPFSSRKNTFIIQSFAPSPLVKPSFSLSR